MATILKDGYVQTKLGKQATIKLIEYCLKNNTTPYKVAQEALYNKLGLDMTDIQKTNPESMEDILKELKTPRTFNYPSRSNKK